MPKASLERAAARREEIINACERLYQTRSFKEITLKEIGQETTMSRPSIYNYFQTREEIFLALLEREYERWNAELEQLLAREGKMGPRELAHELAASLERREQLLKLMSMNHFDMEENSREELLVDFKRAYGRSLELVEELVRRSCPKMEEGSRKGFLYAFFPFVYGIYPYAVVTPKQRSAMETAGIDFQYHSIYDLAHACLVGLLGIEA